MEEFVKEYLLLSLDFLKNLAIGLVIIAIGWLLSKWVHGLVQRVQPFQQRPLRRCRTGAIDHCLQERLVGRPSDVIGEDPSTGEIERCNAPLDIVLIRSAGQIAGNDRRLG